MSAQGIGGFRWWDMGWSGMTCSGAPLGLPGQGTFWAGKLLFNHVEPRDWWFIPLWCRGHMLRLSWIRARASEPLLCLLPGFLGGVSRGAETLRLSLLLLHPWCYLEIDGSCQSRGISPAFPIPIWISLHFPPLPTIPGDGCPIPLPDHGRAMRISSRITVKQSLPGVRDGV